MLVLQHHLFIYPIFPIVRDLGKCLWHPSHRTDTSLCTKTSSQEEMLHNMEARKEHLCETIACIKPQARLSANSPLNQNTSHIPAYIISQQISQYFQYALGN